MIVIRTTVIIIIIIIIILYFINIHPYYLPFSYCKFACISISGDDLYKILSHYENTPIQIYRKFHLKKLKKIQIKKSDIFSYFCSKHRLWVLVRTASSRRFYPQSIFEQK